MGHSCLTNKRTNTHCLRLTVVLGDFRVTHRRVFRSDASRLRISRRHTRHLLCDTGLRGAGGVDDILRCLDVRISMSFERPKEIAPSTYFNGFANFYLAPCF